jgi:hypothetical protein
MIKMYCFTHGLTPTIDIMKMDKKTGLYQTGVACEKCFNKPENYGRWKKLDNNWREKYLKTMSTN